ncbi:MAG: DUF3160 domain-containing protein [Myxococcales bacterium]|nr:DUF3160 domain-containing protein [Myxococcales bacterium]
MNSLRMLFLSWLLFPLVACIGDDSHATLSGSDGGEPGSGGLSGTAAMPGQPQPGEAPQGGEPVALTPSNADSDELARLEGLLEEAESISAAEFQSLYAVPHVTDLGYSPAEAQNLELIQASPLSLEQAELDGLERDGFVISARQSFPHFAYGYRSIYAQDLPVYISADSILDAVHRSYDDILKAVEEEALMAIIGDMLAAMHTNLESASLDASVAADLDFFISVARNLLSETPLASTGFADASDVRTFVDGALAADGWQEISLFGVQRDVDFSQFKPRGHYTDSVALERYFRAMMWLGRIDFRLLETQSDGSQIFHRRQFDAVIGLHSLMAGEPMANWKLADSVVEAFVGESDYMRLDHVDALLTDLGVASLEQAGSLSDAEISQTLIDGGYGAQRISSHIMINDLREPGTLPLSRSFALFGQRYVVDSHVFSNLVFDRVQEGKVKRMMPNPLDVAFAALGNDQAAALLGEEFATYGYESDLHSMRLLVDEHGSDYFQQNLYNIWLDSLRALSPDAGVADPAAAGMPRVTATEPWGRRILNTQLASWAQLRHDTVLYVKQSYSGGIACEFPDAYVDPYPRFYASLGAYADKGLEVAELLQPLASDTAPRVRDYFMEMQAVVAILAEMAEYQRAGTPFTDAHMAFINDAVVDAAQGCGWPVVYSGWYARLLFDLAPEYDPTIADVHSQPTDEAGNEVGRVLHVGTGMARLMVVTADTCNGPRAYAGLASSYYEKVTEDWQRLTDEEWATEVDSMAGVPWMADLVVP